MGNKYCVQGKDLFAWLRYDTYVQPAWVMPDKKAPSIRTFDDYWVVQVRNRYMDLENEFVINTLPLINADLKEADRIQYTHTSFLLKQAREELEKAIPEPMMATVLLDQVERYEVWTYAPEVLIARVDTYLSQLQKSNLPEKTIIAEKIKKERDAFLPTKKGTIQRKEAKYTLRAVMDESINVMNSANLQAFINDRLQDRLLGRLILGGIISFFLLLLVSPLAINVNQITGWASLNLSFLPLFFIYLLDTLVIAMLGAGGAFLSGLLQARSSHITFAAYHENMKKLWLRPVVGAIISVVLFILLTWGVLSGVTVQSAGSYMLLAFLSGFSERFFLQIIKTEVDKNSGNDSGTAQPKGPTSTTAS